MPQRPFRITRRPKPAEIPPEPNDAPEPDFEPAPDPEVERPSAEDSAPLPTAGNVCAVCGAYAVVPELHAEYHQRLDGWARHVNRALAVVQRVFRARGYIATTENDVPNDGDSEERP
ncbi:hypothetical protein NONO_c17620 [Nocardia nova SH22a]|uniref:Uncharacterized protein n=1 Tax=Nocardia nova SH22a TaxID=1415166 RepID=W5TBH8_9NOCA|nr:hypothetical protein [Nocardia nova]AHH16562.1 hypothetical protein NONO_c17620 [Nocardia nova SH22a]